MTHVQVDRMAPQVLAGLQTAPIFKKQGTVQARAAKVDEKITTTLEDGTVETKNTAKKGDWLVTNPGGEQYLVPGHKFKARYEESDTPGTFNAKGHCRAIRNPFGTPVEIMASWGSPQQGDEDCWFADVCDADGNGDSSPYLIAADAFSQTYKQTN